MKKLTMFNYFKRYDWSKERDGTYVIIFNISDVNFIINFITYHILSIVCLQISENLLAIILYFEWENYILTIINNEWAYATSSLIGQWAHKNYHQMRSGLMHHSNILGFFWWFYNMFNSILKTSKLLKTGI